MVSALLENKDESDVKNMEQQRLAAILIPRLRNSMQPPNLATPNALLIKRDESMPPS